jgi:hypothetical protein
MTINRKPQQSPSQEFERLDGLVERVTFHSAERKLLSRKARQRPFIRVAD